MKARTKRGFVTLTELAVGTGIAVTLTLAASVFAKNQMALMGHSADDMIMQSSGRAALDLLARDVSMAGVGVGYGSNGTLHNVPIGSGFAGLLNGAFCVDNSGASVCFNQETITGGAPGTTIQTITTDGNGVPRTSFMEVETIDLGVVLADGVYASIAQHSVAARTGQFCADEDAASSGRSQVGVLQRAVLRSQSGRQAQAVTITSVGLPSPNCAGEQCIHGCVDFGYALSLGLFSSSAGSVGANFLGGELHNNFQTAVWHIRNAGPGDVPLLLRAEFDGTSTCTTPDSSCGSVVARQVETLQVQVWVWDRAAEAWQNAGWNAVDDIEGRIRVDIEMVVRSGKRAQVRQPAIRLALSNPPTTGESVCIPPGPAGSATCPAAPAGVPQGDWYQRTAFRTSVDVKNSGRMRF